MVLRLGSFHISVLLLVVLGRVELGIRVYILQSGIKVHVCILVLATQ